MSNSLYSEAIAEAKQLRDAAEANAKKAIIEAMTPQIKKLVERELLEESSAEETNDFMSSIFGLDTESSDIFEVDEFEVDENLLASISNVAGGATVTAENKRALRNLIESFTEAAALYNSIEEKNDSIFEKFELIASNLISEAKTLRDQLIRIVEGDGSADADTALSITIDTIIKETNKMSNRSEDEVLYELDLSELDLFEEEEPADAEEEEVDLDLGDEEDEGEEGEADDEEAEEEEPAGDEAVELELDPADAEALLAALQDALGDEGDEGDEGEEEEVEEAEEGMYAAEEGYEVEEADEAEEGVHEADAGDDEWIEIDEGMLRREIARMRATLDEGDAKKGAKDFGGGKIGGNKKSAGDDFGGGKRGKDPLQMTDKDLNVHAENKKLRAAVVKESRKNRALHGQLDEAVTAVNELQSQLKEMNLFNAKLLYANKLLQNKNISTRQMRSIVESLDNARSLREVKLLYKTMTESLSSKKKGGSLNESTARKAVGSSRPTRSASSTTSETEVDRWATLAGLKK